MKKIVQIGNEVLRSEAEPVSVEDIPSPRIQGVIAQMKETLANEAHGAALAAPQIGEPLQIFVVSGRLFLDPHIDEDEQHEEQPDDLVYINPEIVKRSRQKQELDEGCLSIRGKYGKVPRFEKVTLRAYDEGGKRVERGASGLLAQIFQHETDHLHGTLFIDKATELWEIDENYQPTE